MGRDENWIPLNKRDKISIGRMLAMSAGSFFNSINWNLIFQLSTPIMTKIGIVGTANQCVFLAGIIIVFFVQPILSAYSDQCTFKWGRRRIYIVVSAGLCVIGMLVVAFADKIGEKIGGKSNAKGATTGVFIVFILFWFAGASVYGGPMRAIVSDNCPDAQQVWMSNIYNIVGTFTGILTSLLGTFEVYKYLKFADNETFLLVFGIIVGFVMVVITCVSAIEEPLLEKPPDAKNPIVELINTVKTIPKPALIADIFFVMNSAMTYEKGCWESDFYGGFIYGGKNTIENSPEKDRYQEGLSFFFTVNLVNSIVCFSYSWVNTFVVNKLGFKLSCFIGAIMYCTGLILIMFLKQKYVCMLIWIILFGVPCCVTGSVPGAIVSLSVPSNTLGSHLAILNSFNVVGQVFANVIVGLGLGNLWDFKARFMIGSGIAGGIAAVIMSWFIIVPSREIVNSESNDDESSGSDNPNSL
ncbi:hypothetical protein M9Y10_029959 [Tritrichomonas musculus]|uniref:Major facilitator superfamily transporter n=1 Tax=Tritrichomonas musculus TaxID=1915356 RepID=A0ABR2KNI5_9EUKA